MKEDMSFGISEMKIYHNFFYLIEGIYIKLYLEWSNGLRALSFLFVGAWSVFSKFFN